MHVCASIADSALCLSTGQDSQLCLGPPLQAFHSPDGDRVGKEDSFCRAERVCKALRPDSCRPLIIAKAGGCSAQAGSCSWVLSTGRAGGPHCVARCRLSCILSPAVGWLMWPFAYGEGWLGLVLGVGMPELGVQLQVPKPSAGLGAEKGQAVSGSGVCLVLGQSGAEDPSLGCPRQLGRSLWVLGTDQVAPQHRPSCAGGHCSEPVLLSS